MSCFGLPSLGFAAVQNSGRTCDINFGPPNVLALVPARDNGFVVL